MAPRLSVIVPIYNVERYLPACLDSLASQTFQNLEVVMIDDGSPDGSADIAAEYAARDERFRLVRKENAGLGAARNTGLEHLSPESEFVAFVDSDDVIPSDAYRLMLASLDASGSDFVTGNVLHVNSSKIWQSPMHRFLSRGAVQGTHVTRDLRLLTDRIACNKVFRRDFWERHAFRFPEGVLYEDTPVVVPAQFLARSVDVMSSPTYYWRLRDGESAPSITQRRTEPKAVRDRTAAVLSVSRFFAGRPEPTAAEMKRQYDRTVLTGDLNIFLNVLPAGNDEFREEFFRVVNGYLDQVDPSLVMELPTQARVKWLLVRKHALPELLELFDSQRRGDRLVIEGMLRKYASFAALEGSSVELPKKALRIDREMKAHAPLTEIDWRDGKLHLAGYAWIDRLAQSSPRSAVKVLSIKRDGSRRRTIVPLRNVHAPDCTATLPQRQYNYDWAGWSYEFDPERLRQGKSWKEGVWHLGVGITSSGLVRKCAIHTSGGGAQNFATYRWLDDDFRLLPTTASGSLKLRVERVRALITDRRQVGEELEFEGHVREPMVPGETLRLAVTNRKSGEQFLYDAELSPAVDGRTPFRVRVPMQDVAQVVHRAGRHRSGHREGAQVRHGDGRRPARSAGPAAALLR
jgi:CDP-glycerol glycerophosphotransferase